MLAALLALSGCPRNRPPDAPATPSGPQAGLVDSIYTFRTVTTDPDGDLVSYRFAWGDGDTSDWSAFRASGDSLAASHAWDSAGTYLVRAQAQELLGNLSPWSDALSVVISLTPNAPPDIPGLRGPESARERIETTFKVWCSDPEYDLVQVRVAWGDGDTSDWSEPAQPGPDVLLDHEWQTQGQYVLRAQARDSAGGLSGWSAGLAVSVVTVPYPYRRIATFGLGLDPEGAVLSPDGQLLYVALNGSNCVAVVRTTDFVEVARVPVGHKPFRLAVLPSGEYLYVSNAYSDDVSVVRTSDNTVVATIPVGNFPYGIAALPDGKRVYVANRETDFVSVIDTDRNEVVRAITVDQRPGPVCVHPSGEYGYAGMMRANSRTAVIRTADDSVVAWPKTWLYPFGLAVSPDGEFLYATCDTSIVVIRTSDHEVVEHIPVDESYDVYQPGFLPNGEFMFVTCSNRYRLLVVRASDNAVVDTLVMPSVSEGLAIAADGSRLYVTHFLCDSVTVVGY